MDVLIAIVVITLGLGLPVLGPLLFVWLQRHRPALSPWLRLAFACLVPPLLLGLCLVLVWLPSYAGQCGGWLGETSPCRFAQFVGETFYWATLSLAVPAVVSVVTVSAIQIVLWGRARRERPPARD